MWNWENLEFEGCKFVGWRDTRLRGHKFWFVAERIKRQYLALFFH